MTADHDTTRIVRSWLEEGPTRLPDRVLDAVMDQLPATRQRRHAWPARRLSTMNKNSTLIAAVILIGGITLVGLAAGSRNGPPTRPPAPTATAVPLAQARIGPSGLPPGRYVIGDPFPVRVAMTLPVGWDVWTVGDHAAGILAWTENVRGSGWPLAFWIVDKVAVGSCGSAQLTSAGPSVDELVRALDEATLYDIGSPSAVMIGGRDAVRIDIASLDGDAGCPGRTLWSTPSDPNAFGVPREERYRAWIVDVDGERLVITAADYPHTSTWELQYRSPDPRLHEDDLAELATIIESISFDG